MSFDILSISLFIIALCIAGFWGHSKSSTFSEFALSKSFFGSFALIATIVASFIGGGTIIGNSEKSYTQGLSYLLPFVAGFSVQLILIGALFAKRVSRFDTALSVGDIFKTKYGKNSQLLIGIIAFLYSAGVTIPQTMALGKLVGMLSPLAYEYNVLIGMGFVIAYCYFGGIRSVVTTDVLQFVIFVIIIPVIFFYSIIKLGGIHSTLTKIPDNYFRLTHFITPIESIIIFISLILGDILVPPMTQRLLMAKDPNQSSRVAIIAGTIVFPISIIGGGLGILAYAYDPNVVPSQAIQHMFTGILPSELKIFAILGMIAVVMSSVDTMLTTSSVLLVHDIIKPSLTKKLTLKREFQIAKLGTILIGAVAIIISMHAKDILSILINVYKFWAPTAVVPLIGILFNKSLTTKQFYYCVFSGALLVILWELLDFKSMTTIDSLVPGILTNLLVFIILYQYNKKKHTHSYN